MPFLTFPISSEGPVVEAVIDVSATRANALRTSGEQKSSRQHVRLLIDTGASSTSLDPCVLENLRASETGTAFIHTSTTGAHPVARRVFDISLRINAPAGPAFVIESLPVTRQEYLVTHNIHGLLGRDVLRQCMLIYNGQTRQFTLVY